MRRTIAAVVLVAGLWAAAPAHAAGQSRLLFTSDWSGSGQIYAVDPSGGVPTAQVSVGHAPKCTPTVGCDYGWASGDPVPSPNGRFILYTKWSCALHGATLVLARADGTRAHVVARSGSPRSGSLSDCPLGFSASWAPNSKRFAYAADGRIHTVDLDGRHNRVVGRGDRVNWSPDGSSLAFSMSVDPYTQVGRLSLRWHGRTRVIGDVPPYYTWSPDGRWLAYAYSGTLRVIRPDGSGDHILNSGEVFAPPAWSGDSRFVSVSTPGGVTVVNAANRASYLLDYSTYGEAATAWRKRGHVLAVVGKDGAFVVDAATRAVRRLTTEHADLPQLRGVAFAGTGQVAWSPDGSEFAYTTITYIAHYSLFELNVVTDAGQRRTLISSDAPYGGKVWDPVWTAVPRDEQYRRAQPRVLAAVSADGLTAPWPITSLAADGDRVAYISCGRVFVWTPSAQAVRQAEPTSSLSPWCALPGQPEYFSLYALALSGDRVAYAYEEGGSGKTCALEGERIGTAASFFVVSDFAPCAIGCGRGFGDISGAGGLLVGSVWDNEVSGSCPGTTVEQEIRRIDDGAGTDVFSTLIAKAFGPLIPFDVDAGRVLAGGDNATVILDGTGIPLLSVPVSPLAAQLTGSELVIVVRGRLLVYDAHTGVEVQSWPLPDVPSGAPCGSPFGGTWECRGTKLVLEDASHGLAAYIFDGRVHVVQLRTGAETTIAKGTLARFMNAGLVYADGADLHLVPYDKLPTG